MEDFLQAILNRCLDVLESDVGSILLIDKNKGDIVVRVARGEHQQSILGQRIQMGEGIAGLVALRKEPLLIEDVRQDSLVRERCRMDNYRTHSFLSVPIINSSKLLGVINITGKTDGKSFSIKELAFVSAIADCTGRTIQLMMIADSLEKQLASFQTSTAVTKLTSSIAHELNNPLDGTLRYTNLCLKQVDENSILKEYLMEIKQGLQRMAEIIKGMLELSFAGELKGSSVPRQDVDVNSVLNKTVSFFQHEAACRHIKIETLLADNLPRIADYGLHQVFMNFIKNAFEAIGENGSLIIRSHVQDSRIQIEFSDSGKGIEESVKEKIFEPFFSTKPEGKGLGLAIVKEIISCYNGLINVEGVSQGGAKFTIVVPIGG